MFLKPTFTGKVQAIAVSRARKFDPHSEKARPVPDKIKLIYSLADTKKYCNRTRHSTIPTDDQELYCESLQGDYLLNHLACIEPSLSHHSKYQER